MAIAETAKIVFQTALAGTLESRGFRRVSDTNYVIEGDGAEWRVVFGPEFPDDPGTFRDETGIFLPEIDEINHLAFPEDGPISRPLAMTRYRAHYIFDIEGGYLNAERAAGVLNPDFTEMEPCFRKQEGSQGRREHWTTTGYDLEALGIRIKEYWNTFVWPRIEGRMTKFDACRYLDGSINVHGIQTGLFGPWVCGHHDAVRNELLRKRLEALKSNDSIMRKLEQRAKERHSSFPLQWLFHKPKPADVERYKGYLDEDAKTADHLASVLGIDLL